MEIAEIKEPFKPSSIEVETKNATIGTLIEMLNADLIDLQPGFQRNGFLWNENKMSQLVESIILGLPIPSFYFERDDEKKRWVVIDGLQRLCTLKRLIDEKKPLVFRGMEFIGNLWNGKTYRDFTYYDKVEFGLRPVTLNILKGSTPPGVKFIIFKRINSAGTPLKGAEIRNALFQGKSTELISRLLPVFHEYTGNRVSSKRMNDRDYITRFMALYLKHRMPGKYQKWDDFLNDMMAVLNREEDSVIETIAEEFEHAINNCFQIFGDLMFRKPSDNNKSNSISMALFDAQMIPMAELSESEVNELMEKKNLLRQEYINLFSDESMQKTLSDGTGHASSVNNRINKIRILIDKVLNKNDRQL
jgi:hypothetical protein